MAWTGPAGQEQVTEVVLKHRAHKPFRILSARTSNPLFQVRVASTGAGASQTLQVLLSAQAQPGVYDERVFLTLDVADSTTFELKIAASLR